MAHPDPTAFLLAIGLILHLMSPTHAAPSPFALPAKFDAPEAFVPGPGFTVVAEGNNTGNSGAFLRWRCGFEADKALIEYKHSNLTLPECTAACDALPACRSILYWRDARNWRCLLLTCSGSLTPTSTRSYSLLKDSTATFKLVAQGNTPTNTIDDRRRFVNAFNTTDRLFLMGHTFMNVTRCLGLCKANSKCAAAFLYLATSVWTCIGLKTLPETLTSTSLNCYSYANTAFSSGDLTVPANFTLAGVGSTSANTDSPQRFSQAFDSNFRLFDVIGLSLQECLGVCNSNVSCKGVFFYRINLIWRCQGLSNISGPLVPTSQFCYSVARFVSTPKAIQKTGVFISFPYTQATLNEVSMQNSQSANKAGYAWLSPGHLLDADGFDYYRKGIMDWVTTASRGLHTFEPFKVAQLDVSQNITNTQVCNRPGWVAAVRSAITASGDDINSFEKLAVIYPPTRALSTTCMPDVAVASGCCLTQYSAWTANLGTIAHELGHNLGLPHANSHSCLVRGTAESLIYGPGCEHVEYGDPYCPMGVNVGTQPFNPVYSDKLGWIADEDIVSLTPVSSKSAPLTSTFHLAPFAMQNKSSVVGAVRAVKFELPLPASGPLSGVQPGVAYVSFRTNDGIDAGRGFSNNVFIHWKPSVDMAAVSGLSSSSSYLIDTHPAANMTSWGLRAGESWRDPSGTLIVTFVSLAPAFTDAVVSIQYTVANHLVVRGLAAAISNDILTVSWVPPSEISSVKGYTTTIQSDLSEFVSGDFQTCSLKEGGFSSAYTCAFNISGTGVNARYSVSVTAESQTPGQVLATTGVSVTTSAKPTQILAVSTVVDHGDLTMELSYPPEHWFSNLPQKLRIVCGASSTFELSANSAKLVTFRDDISGDIKQRAHFGPVLDTTFTCSITPKRGDTGDGPIFTTETLHARSVPRAIEDLLPQPLTRSGSTYTATIVWTTIDNGGSAIIGYQYQIDGGDWSSTITFGTSTSAHELYYDWAYRPAFDFKGYAVGTSRTFRIRGVNAFGAGDASVPKTINFCTAAKAPTNVTAYGGNGHIFVSWIPPVELPGCEPNGYRMQLMVDGGAETNYRSLPNNDETFFIATRLTDRSTLNAGTPITMGVRYKIIIYAKNDHGSTSGADSSPAFATPTVNGPLSPTITTDLVSRVGRATGDSVKFVVAGTSPDGGTLSYQWFLNNNIIDGAISSTLLIENLGTPEVSNGYYHCMVYNNKNYQRTGVRSSYSLLRITPHPYFVEQPVSQTKNKGNFVSLKCNGATDENSYETSLSFQWQLNGVNIPGARSNMYFIFPLQNSDLGSYTCVMTQNRTYDSQSAFMTGGGFTVTRVTSTPAVVSMQAVPNPVISGQPSSAMSLTAGQPLQLSVTASGVAGGALTFAWRRNGVAIPGATTPTYTKASVLQADAGTYTVVVTDTLGTAKRSIESDFAVISVGN